MARWTDLAEWRGPTVNQGPAMTEWRGLVIHIAEGYYEGTIGYQKNNSVDVSSHFVLAGPRDIPHGGRDGKLAQVVDTAMAAWTQRAGNGHWLSVECSGFTPDKLSAAQVESVAQLLARAHREYGVPLEVAYNPTGRGLGHHSMGTDGHSVPTDNWTGPTWGHEDCPGPAIIAQKPAIVARAIEIIHGTGGVNAMPTMLATAAAEKTRWVGDGIGCRLFKGNDADWQTLQWAITHNGQPITILGYPNEAYVHLILGAPAAAPAAVELDDEDRAAIAADLRTALAPDLRAVGAEVRDAVADGLEGGSAAVRADA